MAFCVSQERTRDGNGCPSNCPDQDKPVCGSDGMVYKSECELKLLNCGSNRRVSKVDFDKCKARREKCSKITCTDEEDLVCGTDAKTYKNQCYLSQQTCFKNIQLAHLGSCTTLKKDNNCPKTCTESHNELVCGSDGNVYK